jgi:hypothetical protein
VLYFCHRVLDKQKVIIIDPIFHLDKALVGPLFSISQTNGDIFRQFGDAFELYVNEALGNICHTTGEKLIPKNDLLIQTNRGDIESCDACIVVDNKLIVIEMKARWVRDDCVYAPDYMEFIAELRKKYGNGENASYQLARNIQGFIEEKYKIPNLDINKIDNVYPILIAYDSFLSTPGYSWFFSSELRSALSTSDFVTGSKIRLNLKNRNIAPITVIPVNILEDLIDSVNNFRLSDLVVDYFQYCDINYSDVNDDFSLSAYISLAYESKMNRRGKLIEKSLEVFHETIELIRSY